MLIWTRSLDPEKVNNVQFGWHAYLKSITLEIVSKIRG
jgi:hypothetical protein